MLYKFPRTPHLPWSPGATSDDKRLNRIEYESQFLSKPVVVTEKMDGEGTTMYRDHIHARSLSSDMGHPSRSWISKFWAERKSDIPSGWRITGENLYAVHSIEYVNLPSYFMCFGIWNDKNMMLAWDEMLEWCELLGLEPVRRYYLGKWEEWAAQSITQEVKRSKPRTEIRDIRPEIANLENAEGFVLRLQGAIAYQEYGASVAKYVRENHVSTSEHWMYQQVRCNSLAK